MKFAYLVARPFFNGFELKQTSIPDLIVSEVALVKARTLLALLFAEQRLHSTTVGKFTVHHRQPGVFDHTRLIELPEQVSTEDVIVVVPVREYNSPVFRQPGVAIVSASTTSQLLFDDWLASSRRWLAKHSDEHDELRRCVGII